MIDLRDKQVSRLYKAERAVRGDSPAQAVVLADMKAVRAYVKKVVKSAWWQKRSDITEVDVRPGRGEQAALGYRWLKRIVIPKWARNDMIILHELCHLLIENDCAAHGSEFAYTLITMVQHFKGVEAAKALKASFKKHNVNLRCKKCSICKKGMADHWHTGCGDCHRRGFVAKAVFPPPSRVI